MNTGDDILIKDGVMRPIAPMNGTDYSLTEMQNYVGGYIETLRVGKKIMVVNEVGKVRNMPINKVATDIIVNDGYSDYICGPAMLIHPSHIK